MIDLSLLISSFGIICSIVGVGWGISRFISRIEVSLAEIRLLLLSYNSRLDKIEHRLDVAEKELYWDKSSPRHI